ncbi:MAG TPA: DUF1573 domain-containing protein [Candidatus Acidoferrum sp.]|nr:DUF1573 domain-containing protein [Candidatus Acidoferrum sp.]
MKLRVILCWIFAAFIVFGAGILGAEVFSSGGPSSPPVYVPNGSRENQPLTAFQWDATMKTTNVPADAMQAHLVFYFTNNAQQVVVTPVTNVATVSSTASGPLTSPKARTVSPQTMIVTNVTWVTNTVPAPVVIDTVHPSCGCTTAQLPPLPWMVAPGTNGQIGVTVNLAGKFGTIIKTVHVATDQGSRDLIVQITILPPVMKKLTQEDLMRQMAIAKIDRQAVFKNDCATCHVQPGQYKYGKDLYDADCGICHEAEHRATMVPDLHNLKVPTNEDFWRTWIAHGKPGTFMPAFSQGDGGPLSDMQIASLTAYLNAMIPSRVPQKSFQ